MPQSSPTDPIKGIAIKVKALILESAQNSAAPTKAWLSEIRAKPIKGFY